MDKRIKLYFKRMLEKNKEVVINRFIIKYLFGEDVTIIDLSKYVINKITSRSCRIYVSYHNLNKINKNIFKIFLFICIFYNNLVNRFSE